MNDLFDWFNTTGMDRVDESLNIGGVGSSDFFIAEFLVISRILFAVVMIGFIGYFFDRLKQTLLVKSEEHIQRSKRR